MKIFDRFDKIDTNEPCLLYWKNTDNKDKSFGYVLFINKNRFGIGISKFNNIYYNTTKKEYEEKIKNMFVIFINNQSMLFSKMQ